MNGAVPAGRRSDRVEALLVAGLAVFLSQAACTGDGEPTGEARTSAILEARTRGLAHLQEDRLEEAREAFLRLAELAPAEGSGPANLALVALRQGRHEEARERAREALEREPDDPWIHLILAEAIEAGGDTAAARARRRRALELDPDNRRALWTLAGGSSEGEDAPPHGDRRIELLRRLLARAPAGLPPRLELIEALLARGETGGAGAHLEEIRSVAPALPAVADRALERALDRARAGDARGGLEAVDRLHERMRLTPEYRADVEELEGPRGEVTGFPFLSFSHELSLEVPDEAAVLAALRFSDATSFAGLDAAGDSIGGRVGREDRRGATVAVGDLDGDGDRDLYVWRTGSGSRLLRNDLGRFVDATPAELGGLGAVTAAAWADVDADGRLDLLVAGSEASRLYRNRGDGTLEDVTAASGLAALGDPGVLLFADLDHDGDLDLLAGGGNGASVHRNRGDGRFETVPGAMGLTGSDPVRDAEYADFDDDGDLDLVTARGPGGVELHANLRQGRFAAVADSLGLGGAPSADAVAVGDVDGDGRPDLLVTATATTPVLYRNRPGGFTRDRRSRSVLAEGGPGGTAALLLDFDNDGHLDLFLPGRLGTGRPALLHNDGTGAFTDHGRALPDGLGTGRSAFAFDYNEDGDLDLLAVADGGPRLLRNDGGNVNHHFDLRLVARGPGSGKVNRFGIGSRVEVVADSLYQLRTVRAPETHVGLGRRLKPDVVRILWTNGVPQYLYYPGSDQELIESRELKGSCAFVYAWDGEGYRFVTDAVWRSALGMPVGIMAETEEGSGRTYAPAAASREYLRIPGDRLRARDGRYYLRVTEELWEVAYLDQLRLLTVDHPDSVEVFVDERFVPPGEPRLELHRVVEPVPPLSATDAEGEDLLPALRQADFRYVSDLRAGPYQGIVEPHAMILELPPEALEAQRPLLLLRGWIFPTDASINVAVAQSEEVTVRPPRLEVPDGRGGWRTAIPNIGFPAGKDKTVVVDLTGLVPADDPRVRIRTNMQVYWDRAFFAAGDPGAPIAGGAPREAVTRLTAARGGGEPSPRLGVLRPSSADLRFRGFSREYRRGGRHGPHWFDYEAVSAAPRWRPIPGRYTRYGDVLPLLDAPDDRYVVMAPGDELAVSFEADDAPELSEGWTRTFLLYSDGWIKDADLNTAGGDAVGPLPFHGQSGYPPPPAESYPSDSAHRAFVERYLTREVRGSVRPLVPGGPRPAGRRP